MIRLIIAWISIAVRNGQPAFRLKPIDARDPSADPAVSLFFFGMARFTPGMQEIVQKLGRRDPAQGKATLGPSAALRFCPATGFTVCWCAEQFRRMPNMDFINIRENILPLTEAEVDVALYQE